MAMKLKRIYDRVRIIGRTLTTEERREERQNRVDDTATIGRWIHRLIGDVQISVVRRHGHVDFYMTQFLTGHGCFREYLCKYGHDNEVNCSFCDNGNENAEHIFFYWHRFGLERELLETMIDERVTPDNIVSHIQRSVEVWCYVEM